jgi:hypothetical protein
MSGFLFVLLGIGMMLLFILLNRFIPYLTADESKSSGRKGASASCLIKDCGYRA